MSDTALMIEPIGKDNIEELAALYFRRGPFLKFRNTQIVEEYLRRNLESKSHLYGHVIRKNGKIVGSGVLVRTAVNAAALLFTVTDEAFKYGLRPHVCFRPHVCLERMSLLFPHTKGRHLFRMPALRVSSFVV